MTKMTKTEIERVKKAMQTFGCPLRKAISIAENTYYERDHEIIEVGHAAGRPETPWRQFHTAENGAAFWVPFSPQETN